MIDPKYTPWFKHYGDVAHQLDIPDLTLYQMVARTASKYPQKIAYEYMGDKATYKEFIDSIDNFAACLYKQGIRKDDHVLICLPNSPQAVISFYAVNRLDAIAIMVHPLSARGELKYYTEYSDAKLVITLDMFYDNFPPVEDGRLFSKMIVSKVSDGLSSFKGFVYNHFMDGRKDPEIDTSRKGVVTWKQVLEEGGEEPPAITKHSKDPAVILFTGGTTGRTKGAVLSSLCFNSTALGMVELSQVLNEGEKMMAVMPMFHGFGLCACVHLPFCIGICCELVPRFTPDSYSKLIVKKRPSYIAGVPTLYEHMIRSKWLQKADLSCLKGVFCGGDTLTIDSKERMDTFLKEHGCGTFIREGYGCTECLTATTITPKFEQRPGSVGVPMPDMYFKIVKPGTEERLPFGEDGEICLSGPAVMLGYYKEEKETANALRVHEEDGMTWLHTGDIGNMDADGFIYFKQRIKRMIITSGYNVYPSQVENVLDRLPFVKESCVIGVPDDLRGHRVKAYIVLEDGTPADDETLARIKAHAKENIARFAKPREYEFIDALPRTKVAKVDYRKLEAMSAEKAQTKTN